ncbi:Transcription factor bHLH [Abeliophyllum distichum]|uniref:Transcription factor bHLH n=1 Tax=Abeliophyllum distichum TaxID=126358 RepID=A0ABD1PWR3_9LAMI
MTMGSIAFPLQVPLCINLAARSRMYVGVAQKKYRKVKEVGKIKMTVGSIAFYQLVQVRPKPDNVPSRHWLRIPLSWIRFGVGAPDFLDGIDRKDGNVERENTSLKEDLDDIDVLLSMEDEEHENGDDEVSTGRTDANYGSNSPDSCSNYISLSEKSRSSFRKSSSDKKQVKLRKMVKALRGIVPGANRMSTVAVLDEAVRYLKSLQIKMLELEVQKAVFDSCCPTAR